MFWKTDLIGLHVLKEPAQGADGSDYDHEVEYDAYAYADGEYDAENHAGVAQPLVPGDDSVLLQQVAYDDSEQGNYN